MKKVFSILIVAFAMTALVNCSDKDNGLSGNNPGGGNAQSDTSIMNYTLMRSLVNIDWDEACNRIMSMGFTEINPEDLEDNDTNTENVRAFIKGNIMGDYYACYLRCDTLVTDNLVGGVVMHENHLNTSSQTTCIENDVYFINDELRVLSDMNRDTIYCGGNIMWGDLNNGEWDGPNETFYPHASSLDSFIAYLRALPTHNTVNANWADTYIYSGSRYTASCSAIINNQPYTSLTTNVITLVKEDNFSKK